MASLQVSDWSNLAVAIGTIFLALTTVYVFFEQRKFSIKEKREETDRSRRSFLLAVRAYLQSCELTLERYEQNVIMSKAYTPRKLILNGSISFDSIPLHIRDGSTVKDLVQLLCEYNALDQVWEVVRQTVDSVRGRPEPMAYKIVPRGVKGENGWQVIPEIGSRPVNIYEIISNKSPLLNINSSVGETLRMTKFIITRVSKELETPEKPSPRKHRFLRILTQILLFTSYDRPTGEK